MCLRTDFFLLFVGIAYLRTVFLAYKSRDLVPVLMAPHKRPGAGSDTLRTNQFDK